MRGRCRGRMALWLVGLAACSDLQQASVPHQTVAAASADAGDDAETGSNSGTADATTVSDGGATVGDEASSGGDDGDAPEGTTGPGDDGRTEGDDDNPVGSSGGECVPDGAGLWANCEVGRSCGDTLAACISLSGGDSICTFGCASACDCPPAPEVGGAVVTCDDITGPGGDRDGMNECFLSCANGETCPGAMVCLFESICMHPGPADQAGYYEACGNGVSCPVGATCGYEGSFSTCIPEQCDADIDCPTIPSGVTVCGNALEGGGNECYLSCDGDNVCPPGWTCVSEQFCAQPAPG